MRPGNEQTIKEAFRKLVKAYGMQSKLDQVKVKEQWSDIVGEHIAKHTLDVFIKDRKLVIKLDSAPLKHELNYEKDRIRTLVNQALDYAAINVVEIW